MASAGAFFLENSAAGRTPLPPNAHNLSGACFGSRNGTGVAKSASGQARNRVRSTGGCWCPSMPKFALALISNSREFQDRDSRRRRSPSAQKPGLSIAGLADGEGITGNRHVGAVSVIETLAINRILNIAIRLAVRSERTDGSVAGPRQAPSHPRYEGASACVCTPRCSRRMGLRNHRVRGTQVCYPPPPPTA